LQRDFFLFDKYIAHHGYVDTLRQINHEGYDLIVIPGWLMRNSVLALLSNARSIIGYINDLSFTNRYLNSFSLEAVGLRVKPACQDMRSSHLSERANLILSHYGLEPVKANDVFITRQAEAQNYAVIHAGARFEGRRWPHSRFAEVISYLLDSCLCAEVHLIGDATDSAINLRIMDMVKSDKVTDHAGRIDLYQSKNLIAAAKLFVGNDSGPMHIAAMCGIPTLGILGPNFPQISGPLGIRSEFCWHEFPCTGCNQRGCAYGYRCIFSITASEAIAKINSLMTDK
ncbi:MAG: glycosyltransferase family 9 protein, partial [Candidatus Cloacimonadaceae bacterium]|nr:glycosyltransferase family 9 protein [Candidatus Cloacimonadaceae bacterium]